MSMHFWLFYDVELSGTLLEQVPKTLIHTSRKLADSRTSKLVQNHLAIQLYIPLLSTASLKIIVNGKYLVPYRFCINSWFIVEFFLGVNILRMPLDSQQEQKSPICGESYPKVSLFLWKE